MVFQDDCRQPLLSGVSKLARFVDVFRRRPETAELPRWAQAVKDSGAKLD